MNVTRIRVFCNKQTHQIKEINLSTAQVSKYLVVKPKIQRINFIFTIKIDV